MLRRRAAGAQPLRAVRDEGLVGMNVALDEARQQQAVGDVERLVAGGVQRRAEALDAAVADRDILPASADEAAA